MQEVGECCPPNILDMLQMISSRLERIETLLTKNEDVHMRSTETLRGEESSIPNTFGVDYAFARNTDTVVPRDSDNSIIPDDEMYESD